MPTDRGLAEVVVCDLWRQVGTLKQTEFEANHKNFGYHESSYFDAEDIADLLRDKAHASVLLLTKALNRCMLWQGRSVAHTLISEIAVASFLTLPFSVLQIFSTC